MTNSSFPYFLQDYAKLQSHFAEQFDELNSKERGDLFADFVEKLVLRTDFAYGFTAIDRQQHSYDGGVDFVATNSSNDTLWVQAKYRLNRKDDFHNVISKFENRYIEETATETQQPLLGLFPDEQPVKNVKFQIITLHSLDNIINSYEKSHFSSKHFYQKLVDEDMLDVFDGPKILDFLREAFLKSFVLPQKFSLTSVTKFINWENVHLGIVTGSSLKQLYTQYGDSLFFENIRDYLFFARDNKTTAVNEEIMKTIDEEPTKMLARNNGIVFKAESIEVENDGTLRLFNASIVNGCQSMDVKQL